MYKKILITGYTGQLGSDILTKLSNLKKKIIIIIIAINNNNNSNNYKHNNKYKYQH